VVRKGRLVIPADVCAGLGLVAGDRLYLRTSGRRLVIESQRDAATEFRGIASGVVRSRSLVDDLLAERRGAASGWPSRSEARSPLGGEAHGDEIVAAARFLDRTRGHPWEMLR